MRYLFILLFVYLSTFSFSQEMVLDWGACFGSIGNNSPEGVEVLPNGHTVMNVNVRGENSAFTNFHGDKDSWVIVLDNNSSIINDRCFGGSDYDIFIDIEVGIDFIYFVGNTNSIDGDALSEPIGNQIFDLWVVKTDFDLNIIWEKKYGPLGPCWLASSDLTDDNGLVIITDFFSQGGGDVSQYYGGTDIWAFEIDENGEILWEKTLGNAYENNAGNILSTDHNTTMILGETSHSGGMVDCNCHSTDGITRDIWLVELDNQGEIIWQNCYGGSNWELGLDVQQENDGYTLFCNTHSNDGDVSGNHEESYSDYWFFHINDQGIMEWQNCYGGNNDDVARQYYRTADNGYVLIGGASSEDGDVSFNHAAGNSDVWVVVLDSNRSILWEHSYGGTQHNYPLRNSIAQRGEMDFIISATTLNIAWEGGDIDCAPYPVDDEDSNWIFRIYDPTIGANTIEDDNKSLAVYPNPASTQVIFNIPLQPNKIEIKILDIFGNKLTSIEVAPMQAQKYWNCENIASGVYFYHVEIGGKNYSDKILVE